MAYNKIFIDLHNLWALCILWELESLGGMPGKKTGWPGGTANQKKGLQNSGKEGEKTACGTSPRRKRNYNGRRQTGIFYSEGDLKNTGPIKSKGP